MVSRGTLAALPLACTLIFSSLAAAKQPIVETDLLKIKKVTEVELSRDGSLAAYAVLSVETDNAAPSNSGSTPTRNHPGYTYRSHLWLADLRTPNARPVPLTTGDRNDSGLAISPDGSQLAFVRADSKKHPQIWLMSLHSPGEPRMITELEHGASNPRWRDDGKALLVSSAIPLSKLPGKPTFNLERPGREWWDYDRPSPAKGAKSESAPNPNATPDGDLRAIRNWLESNSAANDPSDLTRMAFLGELSLAAEMIVSELFRIDLGTENKATQLTTTFRDHTGATFSPDGTRILFAGLPPSAEHPDRIREQSIIWEAAADGSNERPLLQQAGYSFRRALFTEDGKHLLVTGTQTDQPAYRQARLGITDLDGTHLRWLTPDGDPSVQDPQPTRDGHVYYTVEFHGGQPLRRVNLANGKVEDVVAGPVGINAFAAESNRLVYAQISAENPNELFTAEPRNLKSAQRLTDLHATWLAGKLISMPEEHWITRPDGLKVQYWVMKPNSVSASNASKHPWVLDIHGGPSAMWGPGEFSMWHEFQIFCSFGYGVVYSNPRGSGGYGYSFQQANYKNWGEAPMADVMAALDDTIAHEPAVDTDQLFVTGGSYAGYLTAWIVSHTDRFKAAAALRGVYDLSTFFGEGNAYNLVPNEFGGYPWEPETRRILDEQSPITHVAAIHTPLLIIHGSSDNRTGIVQGQMLFRALKQLNRPVEYIRYPGAGHELTRSGAPQQRMDHMLRIIEFFERYTKNAATPPQGAPAPTN